MSTIKRSGTDIVHAAVLLPVSLAEVGAVVAGRRPQPVRSLVHAVSGIFLGALALVAVGVEILFVSRGVLYGFVDPGPYDHSWGGPTRAGAWLAHFGIGLPFSAAGLVVLWFIAQLHHRLGARWLHGEQTGAWVLPTTLLACAAGAVFVVAWLHQV
jgi:hypothetical protein